MRNKFMRNSCLLVCISFTLSNAYAMDHPIPDNKDLPVAMKSATHSQMPLEEKWRIQEKNTIDRTHCGFSLSKKMTICSLQEDSYIKTIFIGRIDKKDDIYVRILPFLSPLHYSQDHKNMTLDLRKDLKLSNIVYESHATIDDFQIVCAEPSKFLSVFYNRDLIPDCIIDHIVKYIGIEDFRMNTNRLIERINGQMTEDSTIADFKRIAFDELATIKYPARRAEITWGLAQELKESKENCDRQLLIDLCEQINNQNLPFFKEAKTLQAILAFTDDSTEKVSIRESYQKPLISLLSISNIQEDKAEQNNLVKGFISNNVPRVEFPDHLKTLKNLTVSPECTFELLDIIRKQEIELKLLREKNNTVFD